MAEKNKTIIVVGAGDAAFDFALNLADNNRVFLLNRHHDIKALPLLVDKALQHTNITYKENYSQPKDRINQNKYHPHANNKLKNEGMFSMFFIKIKRRAHMNEKSLQITFYPT